jgi:hypothetical protein
VNTLVDQHVEAFARAMRVAEKHRQILKRKFGFDDRAIGAMTMARRGGNAYEKFINATAVAKQRLAAKRAKADV